MTAIDAPAKLPETKKKPVIHPLWVRLTHWINALAILMMVTSGWQIYNASPGWNVGSPSVPFVFHVGGHAFLFPTSITLGKWLGGALMWHFAAMWLLIINGLVYLTLGIATGRFKKKLLPISIGALFHDVKAALTFKLSHADLSVYNTIQKVLYAGVLLLGVLIVLTGLAIWKPVQFQELTALFGGYDLARIIHFTLMVGIVLFVIIHVLVAITVPKSIKAMVLGK